MSNIIVGTYNMSFAGDQGLDPRRPDVYESEAAFHLSNPGPDPRQFWKNAADFVFGFWQQEEAGVLGLQEMNLTAPGSGTGSDYIESNCKMIRPSIRMETQHIDPERAGTWPALSILWDSAVFGDKIAAQIYKLDYMPEEAAGGRADKSRPILFVYTTKGYLLCCLHGPNSDVLSRLSHRDMKENIDRRTQTFLSSHGLAMNPEKTFFMGDFNDRYDAIKPLVIQGVALTYAGKAPYSCCHNWDSSCSDARYTPIEIPGRGGTGTCRVVKADGSKYALAGPGPREALGPEGNIENYRYTGDKVFGLNPSGPLLLFPPGRSGPSTESDHEMVIGRFAIPDGGSMGGAGSGGNNTAMRSTTGRRGTSFRRSSRKVRRNRSRRSRKN